MRRFRKVEVVSVRGKSWGGDGSQNSKAAKQEQASEIRVRGRSKR